MQDERNLFVSNLPYETEEINLEPLFERFGPIKSVKVIRDKDTNKSRGFGFVEFETRDSATAALRDAPDGMNGYTITAGMGRQTRRIQVQIAEPRGPGRR